MKYEERDDNYEIYIEWFNKHYNICVEAEDKDIPYIGNIINRIIEI